MVFGVSYQYPLSHKKYTNFFLSNRGSKITAHLDDLSLLFAVIAFQNRTSKSHIPHIACVFMGLAMI